MDNIWGALASIGIAILLFVGMASLFLFASKMFAILKALI